MNNTIHIIRWILRQGRSFVLGAVILSFLTLIVSEGTHFHTDLSDSECTQCLFGGEPSETHQDVNPDEVEFNALPYFVPERFEIRYEFATALHARAPPKFS